METLKEKMNDVLNSFLINAVCVNVEEYKNFVSFDLKLGKGTRVKGIQSFSEEIALSLQTLTEPEIIAVPADGVVRIKAMMKLQGVVDFDNLSSRTKAPEGFFLPFLIGEDERGEPLWLDMSKNPHMLVAGTTGSGKSTLLHVLIENARRRDDVDIYLVDPKHGVEFGIYEEDAISIAYEYDETVSLLEKLHSLMNSRFVEMKKLGIKSVSEGPELFSKVLVVIDEVADIMSHDVDKNNPNKYKFQNLLVSLAQKARASGIFLVAATQRPSVDVLTGLIKANFPARIACKVTSAINSKVILDETGAEKLLGNGDAIVVTRQHGKVRAKLAYVNPDK